VVSGFILQALKGEPITLFGDGSQTRSFCYVDDLIEGIVRFMNTDKEFIGPLNLGNPVELSVRSLAETILRLTGSDSALVFKPLPEDDPRQRQPDIGLAKEKLDWKPECELEDGLLQTIAYFDSQLSNGFAPEQRPALKAV
jgi:UDP-glucuronate decarboxylase